MTDDTMEENTGDEAGDSGKHSMRTRKKKWNAHPVLAALTAEESTRPKRRSAAEIKADNEAKERAKVAAEAEFQERVSKIARIEREVEEQDEVFHPIYQVVE